MEATVHVEYVNLSSDERMRFINYTEEYLYYNISERQILDLDTSDFNNLPLRQLFFVGNNCPSASETVTLSTPASISGMGINTINIYADTANNTITDTQELEIFTKRNLYKLYKGYGRDLLITADEAFSAPHNKFKVNPSIKYATDSLGLLQLLEDGKLQGVGTDHAPHPQETKTLSFKNSARGVVGLESAFAVLYLSTQTIGNAFAELTKNSLESIEKLFR